MRLRLVIVDIDGCLAETGAARGDAVMVGDTVMDLEMAAAAGIRGFGAAWHTHPAKYLQTAGLNRAIDDRKPALQTLWVAA